MAMQKIDVRGKQVAVHVSGDGNPILLVHGFPMDARMWARQIDVFAKTNKVIALDLPGFGESDLPEPVMTPAVYADCLVDLLESLQIDEPVTFCGLSMGGYIGLEFWKRHPSRLRRLIFCHTKGTADSPEAVQNRKKTADSARLKGAADLARDMPAKLTSPETQKNALDVIESLSVMIAAQQGASIAAASLGMAERADFTSHLSQIVIPTLVIAGDKDALIPVAEMESMAKQIPYATFHVIKSAGHLSPMEKPIEFNQIVTTFLAS